MTSPKSVQHLPANARDTARRLKAIIVGSSGNLVEWFDFYAYSAFALYFAGAFFPAESQTASLLQAAWALLSAALALGAWGRGSRPASRRTCATPGRPSRRGRGPFDGAYPPAPFPRGRGCGKPPPLWGGGWG